LGRPNTPLKGWENRRTRISGFGKISENERTSRDGIRRTSVIRGKVFFNIIPDGGKTGKEEISGEKAEK